MPQHISGSNPSTRDTRRPGQAHPPESRGRASEDEAAVRSAGLLPRFRSLLTRTKNRMAHLQAYAKKVQAKGQAATLDAHTSPGIAHSMARHGTALHHSTALCCSIAHSRMLEHGQTQLLAHPREPEHPVRPRCLAEHAGSAAMSTSDCPRTHARSAAVSTSECPQTHAGSAAMSTSECPQTHPGHSSVSPSFMTRSWHPAQPLCVKLS